MFTVLAVLAVQMLMVFLSVGVMTVMESKVLSCLQGSTGPSLTFKGAFLFILDFFKMVVKTSMVNGCLILSFMTMCMLFMMLQVTPVCVLGFVGDFFNMGVVLVLEIVFTILKYSFANNYVSKMVSVSSYSMSLDLLIVEFLYVFSVSPFLFLYFYFDLSNWNDVMIVFDFYDFLVFSPLFVFCFFLVIFQLSSTPFDYFECESEVVGGVLSQVGSGNFVVWSFMEYLEMYFKCLLLVCLFFAFSLDMVVVYSLVVVVLMLVLVLLSGLLPSLDYFSSVSMLGGYCFFLGLLLVFECFFLVIEFYMLW